MNFKENNVTKEKRYFKYDAGVSSSKGQNHEYLCLLRLGKSQF